MTSKTLTLTRGEYNRITDEVSALRDENAKQRNNIKHLTGIAWEHGNRADEAEEEIGRLRAALDAWRRFAQHAEARQWAIPLWGALLWDEAVAATGPAHNAS